MKTRHLVYLIAILVLTGCIYPSYLPNYKYLDQNLHGAYITIKQNGFKDKGELLAVTDTSIFILNESSNSVQQIDKDRAYYFKVKYAKSSYGWSIPLFAAVSFSHGWFGFLSLPVNLATTITLTYSSWKSYTYTYLTLPYDELHKYARFPQGIPDDFNIYDAIEAN